MALLPACVPDCPGFCEPAAPDEFLHHVHNGGHNGKKHAQDASDGVGAAGGGQALTHPGERERKRLGQQGCANRLIVSKAEVCRCDWCHGPEDCSGELCTASHCTRWQDIRRTSAGSFPGIKVTEGDKVW